MTTSTHPATPKAFLRAASIASKLDCSRGHIWNMAKDPRYNFPPPIKLSAQITVFDAELVERWIEERRGHNLKEAA